MTGGAGPSMKETDRNKHPAKSASEFIWKNQTQQQG